MKRVELGFRVFFQEENRHKKDFVLCCGVYTEPVESQVTLTRKERGISRREVHLPSIITYTDPPKIVDGEGQASRVRVSTGSQRWPVSMRIDRGYSTGGTSKSTRDLVTVGPNYYLILLPTVTIDVSILVDLSKFLILTDSGWCL